MKKQIPLLVTDILFLWSDTKTLKDKQNMSRFASSAFRVQNLETSVGYYSKHFQFKTTPLSAKQCLLSFNAKGATLLLTEDEG